MFDVTDKARARLEEKLNGLTAETDVALRLAIETGELELFCDRPQASDACFTSSGRVVLIVDEDLADELSGKRFHWDEGKGEFLLVSDSRP